MSLPTDYNARKEFPLLTFLTAYMPDAIEALVELCKKGNVQHQIDKPKLQPFYLDGDRIAWDRAKSTEECETLMRHLWDHQRAKRAVGGVSNAMYDTDGVLHIVKVAWRAMAEAQKTIEALHIPTHGHGPCSVLTSIPECPACGGLNGQHNVSGCSGVGV
jgi:hypothetical protein